MLAHEVVERQPALAELQPEGRAGERLAERVHEADAVGRVRRPVALGDPPAVALDDEPVRFDPSSASTASRNRAIAAGFDALLRRAADVHAPCSRAAGPTIVPAPAWRATSSPDARAAVDGPSRGSSTLSRCSRCPGEVPPPPAPHRQRDRATSERQQLPQRRRRVAARDERLARRGSRRSRPRRAASRRRGRGRRTRRPWRRWRGSPRPCAPPARGRPRTSRGRAG